MASLLNCVYVLDVAWIIIMWSVISVYDALPLTFHFASEYVLFARVILKESISLISLVVI